MLQEDGRYVGQAQITEVIVLVRTPAEEKTYEQL